MTARWTDPGAYVALRSRPDARPDLYVGFSDQNRTGQVGWDGPAQDDAADAHWFATLAFTAIAAFIVGAFATAALALLVDAL